MKEPTCIRGADADRNITLCLDQPDGLRPPTAGHHPTNANTDAMRQTTITAPGERELRLTTRTSPTKSDDTQDGSHDGDRPAATDDHRWAQAISSGSDTRADDQNGGSRGSDDAPNSTAEPESGGDGSGG